MIIINFTGKINESEQEISSKEPVIEFEEVECLLEKSLPLSDETKKYS